MSTRSRELSLSNGRPIRNYEFRWGPIRWCYTTADRDIVLGGRTFKTGVHISDSGIENSGLSNPDMLTVTLARTSEVGLAYQSISPSQEVELLIWDTHHGEIDYLVSWVGSIQNVKYISEMECEVSCRSIAGALDQPGLTLGWQRGCPHTLYGLQCRVNEANYRTAAVVQSMTGMAIVAQAAGDYPPGYFSGGYLEWEIDMGDGAGVMERRGVRIHTGTGLTLLGGVFGMRPGLPFTLYPGCVRTIQTCDGKFNNKPNYGGVPHLPGRSPFDGNPVF